MVDILIFSRTQNGNYFPKSDSTEKGFILANFLFTEIKLHTMSEWKAIIKGEAQLMDGNDTTLELHGDILTIEIDWSKSPAEQYSAKFVDYIIDIWADITQKNHPFIEIQIDWENEICTARGLESWVHPQKEQVENAANEAIAKFKARCEAIDQKTQKNPELKNALYAAMLRGEDVDLDKI